MYAVDYLQGKEKMCNECSDMFCESCPFVVKTGMKCAGVEREDPMEAEDIVFNYLNPPILATNRDMFRELYGFGSKAANCYCAAYDKKSCSVLFGDGDGDGMPCADCPWWDEPYEADHL